MSPDDANGGQGFTSRDSTHPDTGAAGGPLMSSIGGMAGGASLETFSLMAASGQDATTGSVATAPMAAPISGSLILPGVGSDPMTGSGDTETFAFTPAFGQGSMPDFVASASMHEMLQPGSSIFADFAQVIGAAPSGSDVMMAEGATDPLMLKKIGMPSLLTTNFKLP